MISTVEGISEVDIMNGVRRGVGILRKGKWEWERTDSTGSKSNAEPTSGPKHTNEMTEFKYDEEGEESNCCFKGR